MNNSIHNISDTLENEVLQKKENVSIPGYIYCLFNKMYISYGDDIYKLGNTIDIDKRLTGYCTSYIDSCEILFISKLLRNKDLAEKILFKILSNHRIKDNREFFKCNLEIIKSTILDIEKIFELNSDEEILNTYFNTINNINLFQKIITSNDININEYLEKCNICKILPDPILERFILKSFLNIQHENLMLEHIEQNYDIINIKRKYLLLHDNTYNKYHKYNIDVEQLKVIVNIIDTLDFDLKNLKKRIDQKIFHNNLNKLLLKDNEFYKNYSNIRKLFNKDKHILNNILKGPSACKLLNSILGYFNIKVICNQTTRKEQNKIIAIYYYRLELLHKI